MALLCLPAQNKTTKTSIGFITFAIAIIQKHNGFIAFGIAINEKTLVSYRLQSQYTTTKHWFYSVCQSNNKQNHLVLYRLQLQSTQK